jgi:hypothetical protein
MLNKGARTGRQLPGLLDLSRQDGTESLPVERRRRGVRPMRYEESARQSPEDVIQEMTEPSEIIVCFTRGGTIAHALHLDCKTVLGPWIKSPRRRRWRRHSGMLRIDYSQVVNL